MKLLGLLVLMAAGKSATLKIKTVSSGTVFFALLSIYDMLKLSGSEY